MEDLRQYEGKLVYKRKGIYKGVVGRLVKNPTGLTSHIIEFKHYSSVPVLNVKDIVVVGDSDENTRL